jgi:hypothetical protein
MGRHAWLAVPLERHLAQAAARCHERDERGHFMNLTRKLAAALAALATAVTVTATTPAAGAATGGAVAAADVHCPHSESAPPVLYGSIRIDVSIGWDSCTHTAWVHCLVRNSNTQQLHIDNCAGKYVSTGAEWAKAPTLPYGAGKVETWAPSLTGAVYVTPGTSVYGYVAARYQLPNGQWSGAIGNRTDDVVMS